VALVIREPEDERSRPRAYYDLGQATMAMMIAAVDVGIGSGHSAVGDQEMARRVLGLPDERMVAFLIDFGYPADRALTPIRRPDRRPFEEVVHWGRW
jgi:nitroreductase